MALFELSRPSLGEKWSGPIYKKLRSFSLDEYEVFATLWEVYEFMVDIKVLEINVHMFPEQSNI